MTDENVNIYKMYEEERNELHKEIADMNETLSFLDWISENQRNNFPKEVGIKRIRYNAVVRWFSNLLGRNIGAVKAEYPTMHEFNISRTDIEVMTSWRVERIHELSKLMKEL